MSLLTRKLYNLLLNGVRHISHRKKRLLLQDVESVKGKINQVRSHLEPRISISYILEFDFTTKRNNFRVYVWGMAETGALGDINKTLKNHTQTNCLFVQHPSRLSFGEKYEIIDCAAGYGFTLFAVKPDAHGTTLFGTGINTDSQIGYHKHRGVTNKPIEIMIAPAPIDLPMKPNDDQVRAVKVAAGRAHSVVLSKNGAVFTLGNNAYGQCARPIIADEEYFGNQIVHRIDSKIFDNQPIESIVCGQDHSLFVTQAGSVYSCGWGADGQTGLGHYSNQHQPQCIEGDVKNEKIVKVSCKGDCTLALNDKGEVFGFGNSEYGQIALETQQQINVPVKLKSLEGIGKIVDIAAGGSFCAVLNEAGDVFVWGYGILGFGPQVDHYKDPTLIPPTLFGRNSFNPESRVISISCGLNHITAINSDNDLFTWGRNKYGCLGLGHDKDQFFPFKTHLGAKVIEVKCGVDHTIALCRTFI